MADKMKHDFYVPVVRQVALDNVPFKNGTSSKNFGVKNPCSQIDQKCQ